MFLQIDAYDIQFGLGSVAGIRLLSDPSFDDKCIETDSLSVLKAITGDDSIRTEEKYDEKIYGGTDTAPVREAM